MKREKRNEPSTAEKLLWLAKNKEIAIIWKDREEYKLNFKTLAEAINATYEWAKENNIGTKSESYMIYPKGEEE